MTGAAIGVSISKSKCKKAETLLKNWRPFPPIHPLVFFPSQKMKSSMKIDWFFKDAEQGNKYYLKLYILTSPSSLPLHILLSLSPIHVTGPWCPVKVRS